VIGSTAALVLSVVVFICLRDLADLPPLPQLETEVGVQG
jgi:hypothetical protein